MSANPITSTENKGCALPASLPAPPQPECVHAGGDFGTPACTVTGGARCTFPIGDRSSPAPLIQPLPTDFKAPIQVILGQTRILLSEAASRHLDATGEDYFMIASKAKSPDVVGRWVIHLAPCPLKVARQAEGVLLGTHRAVKLPTSSKP